MRVNITVFAQIVKYLDKCTFNDLVKKHQTDHSCKRFNSWTHMLSMVFCHISKSCSVRDISNGLRSATGNLNHLGIKQAPIFMLRYFYLGHY